MVRREGESDFINNLDFDENGEIKIISKKNNILVGQFTKEQACNLIKKIAKNTVIAKEVLDEHFKRLQNDVSPHNVFKELASEFKQIKNASSIPIKTAKLFRQIGIFKYAEKKVYQDLETGDFWKISDDGKSVLRMFKELNDGAADKVS